MRLLPNGIKIGNATVIVDIIPKSNPEIRPGGHMKPTHVTDHDTGNAGRGANAEMHNRYIHNMASYHPKDTSHVSWHLTVDEKFIYQHIPFDEPAYHCGDGFGIKSGNRTSIGVEKCMNVDGDRAQTEENAIALHVYLLKNVIKKTPNNVVPHQHWSGKYCPAVILRRDGSFIPFRNRIQNAYSGTTSTYTPPKKETGSVTITNPTTSKSISQMASEVISGKHGSGHSNRRKSLGISQSEYEKVRAEVNRRAGSSTPPRTTKSITQMAQEVAAGEHGNGHENRRKSLGISKTQYNKVRSEVNRLLAGGTSSVKSISQMAQEVIRGDHGSGHANRRKSLGISQSEYEKVRAEVNRRL